MSEFNPTWSAFRQNHHRHARPQITYTSVANGPNTCIELNSDLVYCTHSCQPTLVFDMIRFEVRVADDRPLAVGDELTFFYPSTEWTIVQAFQCQCGMGGQCLGMIAGSRDIEPALLQRYWLNEHVGRLLAKKVQLSNNAPLSQVSQPALAEKL